MSIPDPSSRRGQWMALAAAILGWMFDGFEVGLFPLAAPAAIRELVIPVSMPEADARKLVGVWMGVMTAGFLVGASSGGVLFGWLGDRLGRVRAMTLSVLTYAVFSGLCSIVTGPWQLFSFRFIASLGMGGEWALGVSLVMELWPTRSRAWLAGLIGAASNVGFVLVAVLGLGLSQLLTEVRMLLAGLGLESSSVDRLTANSGWRLLMASGALPAVLTFFIRLFVPESERWCDEHSRGATRQWSTRDLLAVVLGTTTALGLIALWAVEHPLGIAQPLAFQVVATLAGLAITYLGYTYPLRMYLRREAQQAGGDEQWTPARVQRRLMIGAALSGVALLGTWASIQQAPSWAGQLAASAAVQQNASVMEVDRAAGIARAWTQISSGLGAIVGTIGAAFLGSWIGRRSSYAALCIASLASSLLFFQ